MAERLDQLPAEAARAHPARTAVAVGERRLDFATLDRRVSAVAAALGALLPDPGSTVAVAAVLDPDFAVAYYAAARAGHVAAVVNPLVRQDTLVHLLSSAHARVAFVDAAVYERLAPVRDRLPQLRHLVLLGPAAGERPDGVPTLDSLASRHAGAAPVAAGAGGQDVACIQFTSGTTGLPKAVRLTHRNLTVNARQTARAHDLGPGSVAVNHLPTYHPMHLNSAVCAGATQVLCTAHDPAEAVAAANEHRATHLYSLPVRLARLADHPDLSELRLHTVRRIASGGSALAPSAAARLTARFGVPVFQGYGLAETSPLTHSDDPDHPVHGSVGPPVQDTECRVVDVESREVLPAGGVGEVQLRGPQVMKGYLGGADGSGLEPDGWLSSGDVGRIGEDGRLFLVDRLKDTFKCDNFLVAPSEIEEVLHEHPLVHEAVVVDVPDEFSGAVAAALVLPVRDAVPGDARAAVEEVREYVNEKVPYYQRLRHLEPVDTIPRSPNGKIQRRVLRERLLDCLKEGIPMSDPRVPAGLFTVVNTFVLKDPASAGDFEKRFLDHVQWMRAQDGFDSHQAVRLTETPEVYVNLGRWASPEHFQRVMRSEVFQSHAKEFHQLVDVEAAPSVNVVRAGQPEPCAGLVVVETPVNTGAPEEFEQSYRAHVRRLAEQGGFLHADLSRCLPKPGEYTFATWWASAEDYAAARDAVPAPAAGRPRTAVHVAAAAAGTKAV